MKNTHLKALIAAEDAVTANGGEYARWDDVRLPGQPTSVVNCLLGNLTGLGLLEPLLGNECIFRLTSQGVAALDGARASSDEAAPEPAPLAETDGQAYGRIAQAISELRDEVYRRRGHNDEPLRVAQDLLGTVRSILQERARNVV